MPLTAFIDDPSDDEHLLAQAAEDIASREIGANPDDRSLWKSLAQDFGAASFGGLDQQANDTVTLAGLIALHRVLGYHVAAPDLIAHHLVVALLSMSSCGNTASTLDRLASGELRGALHLPTERTADEVVSTDRDGDVYVTGTVSAFTSAPDADALVVWARDGDHRGSWQLVHRGDALLHELTTLDLTRRVARVELRNAPATTVSTMADPDAARLTRLSALLHASEAVGGAHRCLDLAVDHAFNREQFGRPVGSFQAVKHALAAGLIRAERATATLKGAAREGLTGSALVGAAQRVATSAHLQSAHDLIQVLGGVGFTWEHEAHLHLRRAASVRSTSPLVDIGADGSTPGDDPEPDAKGDFYQEVRRWFDDNGQRSDQRPAHERRMNATRVAEARRFQSQLDDAGLAGLTWPNDVGGLAMSSQLASEFTLASQGFDTYSDVTTISLGIVAPLLIDIGSDDQRARYLPPLRRLDHLWCQLFSEPGCGSDLAAVATRATRDGDTFVVTGQKIWTTNAQCAEYGLLLARTDASVAKHRGLTMFIVDMAAPGVDVRPIRQITGEAEFCEVFLDGVVLPADAVLGAVDGGWSAALATLAFERVALGSGTYGELALGQHGRLRRLATENGAIDDPGVRRDLDQLRIDELALREYLASMARRVATGIDPGPAASVCKVMTAELTKNAADVGLRIGGAGAVTWDPDVVDADDAAFDFLYAPSTSIAGGTDYIQRNIIAEQMLGLPREPRSTNDERKTS